MAAKKSQKQVINIMALALTFGIVTAVGMLFMGVAWWQFNVWPQTSKLISEWYVGYSPTGIGTAVGTLYGFVDGFIAGSVIAWLYNKLSSNNCCK